MNSQRGSFFIGLIVGLLIGLGLALAVALFVTNAPIPFLNKVPQRTAEQDSAEAEKNKNWDPNSPLYGKNPARPASAAASGVIGAALGSAAAVLDGKASGAGAPLPTSTGAATKPGASASQLATQAAKAGAGTAAAASEPYVYFVQAGAYARAEDAEQQRANLALQGLEAKLSEREQSGRNVTRVRLGPYERKEEAEGMRDKLVATGVDAVLVRTPKDSPKP